MAPFSSVLESVASNVLKNANLITLTKSSTENDRNLTTKVVATRWDDEKKGNAEVSGEKVWRDYSFCEARRSDYNIKKVNFPESTLHYVNQTYHRDEKTKKSNIVITTLSLR